MGDVEEIGRGNPSATAMVKMQEHEPLCVCAYVCVVVSGLMRLYVEVAYMLLCVSVAVCDHV